MIQSCTFFKEKLIVLDTDPKLELLNGVLTYENEPFVGRLESYFDSEKIKLSVDYDEGKKEGLETIWYYNGSIASKRFYTNGLKTGIHKAWWENGKLKFVYHFNDIGEYDGSVKEWYKTGLLFRDFNYLNSKEAGSQKLWYETGKIKANYEVINGERFGLIGLKKCYQVTAEIEDVK